MPGRKAPTRTFANPLPVALGDPFALRWRGQFFLFGTNDGPPLADGRQVPVYRSEDLLSWEPLGGALEPTEPSADHWAPEVLAWNGRFYLVVSFGDVDRVGHALWVAVADCPEGPYRLQARISDPSERFSIDGAWLLDADGRLYLYRCLDFVEEGAPPYGTGIVVQPMADPLTPAGPPATVLRAHAPWQLFEANRTMPLYGGRTFAEWTTIEGPAPVRRAGRVFCGYSGGNYQHAYGTGEAVADDPLGPYVDLRGREGPLFATTPGLVEGPGHFSVVQPDGLHDWIVLHGRRPGRPAREVWLCPAAWGPEGVTIGALTDQPQPAPPRPAFAWRAGQELGDWASGALPDPDGLRLPEGRATLRVGDVDSSGGWLVEAYVRWPGDRPSAAGLVLGADGHGSVSVLLRPDQGRSELLCGEEVAGNASLPTLGSIPFDPRAFHVVQVRGHGNRAEVRVDGVRAFGEIELEPRWLGLSADGPGAGGVVFDALAIARGS